ncbi:MAG: flagellar hook-length control protein FliK [Sulfurospirillaceae bacterium]|nr:flagellar hook-length control protein FliK [Sulfurospirillaceae bacterium]
MEITQKNTPSPISTAVSKELGKIALQAQIEALLKGNNAPLMEEGSSSVGNLLESLMKDVATNVKTKDAVLAFLKNSDLLKNLGSLSSELKSLLQSIRNDENLSRYAPVLQKFLTNAKVLDEANIKSQLAQTGVFLESKIAKSVEPKGLPPSLKSVLVELKEALIAHLKNTPQSEPLIQKQIAFIDKMLEPTKAILDNLPKAITLLAQSVKEAKTPTSEIVKIANKLEVVAKSAELVEVKAEYKVPVETKEFVKIAETLKPTLEELKTTLNAMSEKGTFFSTEKMQEIIKNIDNILSKEPLFQQEPLKNALSNDVKTLVGLIKGDESVAKNSLHVQSDVFKLVAKLEQGLAEQSKSQSTPLEPKSAQYINEDIKAVVLKIKEELQNSPLPHAKEAMAMADKVLNKIEYYQLFSFASSSMTSYLPSLWEGLEDGSISLKKLKENRFFCEINLNLKEHGNIDLLVMLYDENRIVVSVYADNEAFKQKVSTHLSELKRGFAKAGLVCEGVNFFEAKEVLKPKKRHNLL